jgi:uncharacterized membrane protein YhaH (DUF805 family)
MWEVVKSLADVFLAVPAVSTGLIFVKNKRTRNTQLSASLALLWFLWVLIVTVFTRGSVAAFVAAFVLLCLLIFVIHFGASPTSTAVEVII